VNDEDDMEDVYVDENSLIQLRAGLIIHALVLFLFIIAPVALVLFTEKQFTIFNIIVFITLAMKYCIDQIRGIIAIFSTFEFISDDDLDDTLRK